MKTPRLIYREKEKKEEKRRLFWSVITPSLTIARETNHLTCPKIT
jgi:hypothetical protein